MSVSVRDPYNIREVIPILELWRTVMRMFLHAFVALKIDILVWSIYVL